MAYPSEKFRQNPFTTFWVIRRTDKQTKVKTSPPSSAEVIIRPIKSLHLSGFAETLQRCFPGLAKTKFQRFSRTQKRVFKAHKLPLRGSGLPRKFEICCNLRPQKSLQKCQIKYFSYCKDAVHLIMCKSYQGMVTLLEGVLAVKFPGPLLQNFRTFPWFPCSNRRRNLVPVPYLHGTRTYQKPAPEKQLSGFTACVSWV